MTKARKHLVAVEDTPYYHCMTRCVRRAFLCGEDRFNNKNYDHRRQWMTIRLKQLAAIFSIDVCAYSIMSNHYHVILHINTTRAKQCTNEEVATRWMNLCKGHMLVDRWLAKEALRPAELESVGSILAIWRERLQSISWFMKFLNEFISRAANKEDNCKGHFWESRFKSQALLDEAALLTCMAYVDLNPVRAGMASSFEESDFTSIQTRLFEYAKDKNNKANRRAKQKSKAIEKRFNQQEKTQFIDSDLSALPQAPLMPFDGCSDTPIDIAIPYSEKDYFELVDMTSRVIRDDKRGFVPSQTPALINQLGLDQQRWIDCIKRYGALFSSAAGTENSIKQYATRIDKSWLKGIGGVPTCPITRAA